MESSTASSATDCKNLTSVYYILSLVLQVLAFSFGTVYVLCTDSRRREKERKKECLKEWSKFSQDFNSKYAVMISGKVIQRLQHANRLLKDRISRRMSVLDVLIYMIKDEDTFPNFQEPRELGQPSLDSFPNFYELKESSRPTALGQLRIDLRSVLDLLYCCWSLGFLGKIPRNVSHEMRRIVIMLGKLVLPFYSEESDTHHLQIIRECLEKFGVTHEIPTLASRRNLMDEIPYIKSLRYEPDSKSGQIFTFKTDGLLPQGEQFLEELHVQLEASGRALDYALRFAKKMKEKRNGWIWKNPTEKEMILILIHDVRSIIWNTKTYYMEHHVPPLNTEYKDLVEALKSVWGECKQLIYQQPWELAYCYITRFQQDFSIAFGCEDFQRLRFILNELQTNLGKLKIPEFADFLPLEDALEANDQFL